ncbi:RNA polymerase sigma factor [Proteiniphilum sp. UBA5384]|uniref:RNA polymerase sigma factor n=1 Tax=Proteiniphilum sp. UBA5384 TaxID=1947279 RepID=UPI0025E6438B|nr:sigma-70 family RNA polymerase sigma factor [Proteiniphilum sp. UBA5384]
MRADSWQEFLQGDENAFSELYCLYFNELLAYGLKIGFDKEICKDAIQDVFYKIYTCHTQLTHIRNIESYLLHCLKNRLLDLYNVETKINHINYNEIIVESEDSVVERIIEKETELHLEDKIKHSLNALPPKQRKIIYYHYQLNLSFDEIAILLEMKPDTIRKSIHRAIQKMRETQRLKISFPIFLFSFLQ